LCKELKLWQLKLIVSNPQAVTGQVAGFELCSLAPAESGLEPTSCPMYANTACYYSSSTHLNYVNPSESFEDDYRGCSPFNTNHLEEDFHCEFVNTPYGAAETCKGMIYKAQVPKVANTCKFPIILLF